jgi:15,16-dihydrobiliverdin:ferredoxin oxidoreductase
MERAPSSPETAELVRERQKQYDIYSADHDPATGMFGALFGKEWAEEFVYGHLFSLSREE